MNAIYLCFDDHFFPYARACLNSLQQNFPDHPVVLIDYAGDNESVRAFMRQHNTEILSPVESPEFVRYLRPITGSSAVFNRFRLWRSEFADYDTILHLDADTLVLGPLDELFCKDAPYFVSNHEPHDDVQLFSPRYRGDRLLHSLLAADGLSYPDGPDAMINAGVFSVPREFREPREMALLAQIARRYGRYFAYADQSLLSLWILRLGLRPSFDFRYNFQTPFFTDPSAVLPMDQLRILHFSSYRKPGTTAFGLWNRAGQAREQLVELYKSYCGAES